MMRRERPDVHYGLSELSAGERKRDGHGSTGQGGQHQEIRHVRHSCDASNRCHQLDVSGAHSSGNVEQQKNRATDKAGGKSATKLLPSPEGQVHGKSK